MNQHDIKNIKSLKELIKGLTLNDETIRYVGYNFKIYKRVISDGNTYLIDVMTDDNKRLKIRYDKEENYAIIRQSDQNDELSINITNMGRVNEGITASLELPNQIRATLSSKDLKISKNGKDYLVIGNKISNDNNTYELNDNGDLVCNGEVINEDTISQITMDNLERMTLEIISEYNNEQTTTISSYNTDELKPFLGIYAKGQSKKLNEKFNEIKEILNHLNTINYHIERPYFDKDELEKYDIVLKSGHNQELDELVSIHQLITIVQTILTNKDSYEINGKNLTIHRQQSELDIEGNNREQINIRVFKEDIDNEKNIQIAISNYPHSLIISMDSACEKYKCRYRNSEDNLLLISSEGIVKSASNTYPIVGDDFIFDIDVYIDAYRDMFNKRGDAQKTHKDSIKDLLSSEEMQNSIISRLEEMTSTRIIDCIKGNPINNESLRQVFQEALKKQSQKYAETTNLLIDNIERLETSSKEAKANIIYIPFTKSQLEEAITLIKSREASSQDESSVQYTKNNNPSHN